ncbi:hypothetical protein J5O04_10830 [Corynebacterium hindlerae]|uniref:hypothetical protein n=1 Tax=Corynebacterium hindlerae TaxID=699041 RepID=UPI001AD6444E|nr:hypothetical protein [Corynebacterium hindlerae]QTH59283.1 hypothetical protein J5O04_10830 [Corynebacterium hindlerae]
MFELSITQLSEELRRDLASFGEHAQTEGQREPNILRKAARILAVQVPQGTTKFVCTPEDLPLTVALSLHTGIPFSVASEKLDVPSGHFLVSFSSSANALSLVDVLEEGGA